MELSLVKENSYNFYEKFLLDAQLGNTSFFTFILFYITINFKISLSLPICVGYTWRHLVMSISTLKLQIRQLLQISVLSFPVCICYFCVLRVMITHIIIYYKMYLCVLTCFFFVYQLVEICFCFLATKSKTVGC